MKKKLQNLIPLSDPGIKNLLLTMKLALIIVFLSVLQVSANVYSQTTVNLDFNDKSIREVLKSIEQQSQVRFFYSDDLLDMNELIDIKVDNKNIISVLDDIFLKSPLAYKAYENNLIVIAPRELLQQQIVTGIVTEKNGSPLPGVNVVISGTTMGTITDVAGKYSIDVPQGSKSLTFSFIGYDVQEVVLGSQSTLNITLISNVTQLNEVTVVGYGTQKKRAVTGAISSVKANDLTKTTIANFTQALGGKVAGLTALQTTGQPGARVNVKIRSNPSFASSGVLYVLDGVAINDEAADPGTTDVRFGSGGIDRSPLSFINPNDIESIEVLKDASAASIYGARAGAGVILITTKQGKAEKVKLQYNGSYAFQKPAEFYSILSTKDYMTEINKYRKEIYLNKYKIAPYGTVDPATAPPFTPRFTDAQISSAVPMESAMDAISRNGFTVQHNLSMSGGTLGTKYYISGNYFRQQGILKGSDYTKYNGRINLDQKISDNIKVGINLVASNSNADNPSVGTGTGDASGMIAAAMIYPATLPFKDDLGNYPLNPLYGKAANPMSFLEITDKTVSSRLLTVGYVEWNIIKGLKAKANFSYDQSASERSNYLPKPFLYGATVNGEASIGQRNANTKSMEYTLNYEKDLGTDQALKLLGGYSYEVTTKKGFFGGNYDFLTDNFIYDNIGLGGAPRPTIGSDKSQASWASYFARGIYELKERYLLNISVRRDGSSNFALNKKYGIFPSMSIGWIVSDEPFFRNNISFLNFFKFRASYGTTGNSNIGSSAFGYYSSGNNYIFGNAINPGIYLSQINNDELTWETAREFNIGTDFQIMENRVSVSLDYFNKTISDLLTFRTLTADFPVSTVASNVGKTQSRGWGMEIQSRNIVSESRNGFEWNSSFTLSHYSDSWIERSPESLLSLEKYIDPNGPFNGIYGYVSDGIYTGKETVPWMPGIVPGDLIVKDLNGYDPATGNLTGTPDGVISSADMTLLGINDPLLSFGINNTFRYKNFELTVYMYGTTGVKYNFDYARMFGDTEREFITREKNQLDIIKDVWSSTNPNGIYPQGLASSYRSYCVNSDYWIENANFLRCRDIILGYTVPSNIIQKLKVISGLNVSVDFQNVFVLTKYRGLDPELQNFYAYPNPFSAVFSINATF